MCSLFGISDYKGILNAKQISKAVNTLAREAEIRGSDATGIAYNERKQMKVYKRDLPAHKMKFKLPRDVHTVMGHTRLTTQGSEKKRRNNHPFRSKNFALAHNGIISNEKELRESFKLPKTNIETDSYIAVQLLERESTLNLTAIGNMAKEIQGTFAFSLLDREDNLYFVKGNNPIEIYDFYDKGFVLYASTKEILNRSMKRLHIQKLPYRHMKMAGGELQKLTKNGIWEKDTFPFQESKNYSHWSPYSNLWEDDYFGLLMDYGEAMGVQKQDILFLAECGFDAMEIEELLWEPHTIRSTVRELTAY